MFQIINQDIFSLIGKVDAICITTNGYVNKQGLAVMGRGVAKEAKEKWRHLPKILGNKILDKGNTVNILLKENNTIIISLPVKPTVVENAKESIILPHLRKRYVNKKFVPGFAVYADLQIIEESIKKLVSIVNVLNLKTVVLPLPGCGAGELNPQQVIPILIKHLDNRFILCIKDQKMFDSVKNIIENNVTIFKTVKNTEQGVKNGNIKKS